MRKDALLRLASISLLACSDARMSARVPLEHSTVAPAGVDARIGDKARLPRLQLSDGTLHGMGRWVGHHRPMPARIVDATYLPLDSAGRDHGTSDDLLFMGKYGRFGYASADTSRPSDGMAWFLGTDANEPT